MIDVRTAPYAATTLRVVLGFLFLASAGAKLFVFTPAGTARYFGSLGLPPALAYATIGWEVIGGFALILGVYSRAVALAMIPLLLGTIYAVHGPSGFFSPIRTADGNSPRCGSWRLSQWRSSAMARMRSAQLHLCRATRLPRGNSGPRRQREDGPIVMTEQEVDVWAESLRIDSKDGVFSGASNYYGFVARRP